MRNLKRALSLALASVMLLGMMVVGTGASYADVDSADNVEAIEVIQAVGVMSGDDKGNFNPDQKVTRGEMAVVMSNMLGLDIAGYVGANIPFTDVPEWAVPYVAACYADGITAGISATEYGFNYEVTTAQAALMMMKALGYFQYLSDFGSDWQLATVKQGTKIDIFDGIEAGAAVAMTRNEVAQIALNALEANVVEVEGSDGVTIGDVTIGSSIKYIDLLVTADEKYQAINADKDGTKDIVQLGEQLYKGELKLTATENTTDDFGAPANVWTYEDFTGKYAKDADLTYTEAVKVADLEDDLDAANLSVVTTGGDTALTIYSNGTTDPDTMTGADVGTWLGTSSNKLGGTGILTKLYDKDDNDVIDTIVMVYTYAAKITEVTEDDKDTSKDERELKVEAYMGGNKTATITLDKDTTGFDAVYSKVEEDDIVLVVPKTDHTTATEAWSVAIPESVTGAVTAKKSDSITVGGTAYDIAACEKAVSNATLDADKDVVLYLDSYGNAIHTTAVSSTETADVVYVTYAYQTQGSWESNVDMFQGVLADGTIITGKLSDESTVDYDTLKAATTTANAAVAYQYTKDVDSYKLIIAEGANNKFGARLLDDAAAITTSSKKVDGIYFGADVKFIYVTGTKDDVKVTVKSGVQAASATVLDTAYAVIAKDADDNYVVTTVFVASKAVSSSDDLIYIAEAWDEVSKDVKYGDDGETELYGYEAYLNGEKTTIYIASSSNPNKGVGFYTYSVDDETGAYSLSAEKEDTGVIEGKTITLKYVNGNYYASIDTLVDYDANDAKVIDTREDGKINSLSALKNESKTVTASVLYDGSDEVVEYIYITNVA